jgi:hypothetical protein
MPPNMRRPLAHPAEQWTPKASADCAPTVAPVFGKPIEADTHTCNVERQNLNLRMGNRRYTRRSNAFSTRLLDHERHLALWIMYRNNCWMLRPRKARLGEDAHVSPKTGKKRWIKRSTPAMEAGVETDVWEVEDLVRLTDEYVAERRRARKKARVAEKVETANKAKATKRKAMGPTRAEFWVYRSHVHRSAKVHASHCANCRDARGCRATRSRGGGHPTRHMRTLWRAPRSWRRAEMRSAIFVLGNIGRSGGADSGKRPYCVGVNIAGCHPANW